MQSKIESQVMAAVGTIYVGRVLTSLSAIKLYLCAIALFSLAKLVWVARVIENMTQYGFVRAGEFMLNAVVHTDLFVQVSLIIFAVAGASLMRDLVRLSTAPRTLSY